MNKRSHMQPMYTARTKSKDVVKVYGIVSQGTQYKNLAHNKELAITMAILKFI